MKKLFLFITFIWLLLPAYAHAVTTLPASALKISPVVIPLQLIPSQTISIPIKVTNISSSPQPLRASFSDFQTTGEEGDYNFTQTSTNPLLTWSSVSPQEVIVPAESEETVMLTIKTPNKIPVGGYYGMLFFEPVPQPNATKDVTQIVPRIGVLLLGSVGVQNKPQADILTFDMPFLTDKQNLETVLRVKNSGLEYVTAKPILSTASIWGTTAKTTWEDKVVFPGKVRRWTEIVGFEHNFDIVTMHLVVSSGNGNIQSLNKTIIIFPYKVALLFIVLLILGFAGIAKRQNIKKALRILVIGDK